MLAKLEEVVVDVSSPTYHRIHAWRILVQSWETPRFDDHRGMKPSNVSFT